MNRPLLEGTTRPMRGLCPRMQDAPHNSHYDGVMLLSVRRNRHASVDASLVDNARFSNIRELQTSSLSLLLPNMYSKYSSLTPGDWAVPSRLYLLLASYCAMYTLTQQIQQQQQLPCYRTERGL